MSDVSSYLVFEKQSVIKLALATRFKRLTECRRRTKRISIRKNGLTEKPSYPL